MPITVSRTVRTTTSLARCWEFLSDFSHTEQWDPGTVSCRRTDSGPLGLGARFENVSEFRGRQTTLEYKVTTFDDQRHLQLIGENKTVQSIDDMRFSGDDAGAEVVYTATFTFRGMAKLAEPLLHKPLEKLADDAEGGLQRALDGL